MTCVVGLLNDNTVFLGADSLGSNGWSKATYTQRKAFKSKDTPDLIVGYSGKYNFQALEYEKLLDETKLLKDEIDKEYLITKFVPNLKDIVNKYNSNLIKDGLNTMEGDLIFGYRNRLFIIQSDYSVLESSDGYMSIGSGYLFALGSLFSTKNLIDDPKTRIHLALQSAAKFDMGVQAPFYIINTVNDDVIEFKE